MRMDPRPFSLRQLFRMLEAYRKEAWDAPAAVMLLMASLHGDPKKTKSLTVDNFNPYRREARGSTGGNGVPITRGFVRAQYEAWLARQANTKTIDRGT